MPVTMSESRFEELVGDALDSIPAELTRAIENVVVLIEPRDRDDPHLLGLYHGIALTDRMDSQYGGALPDTVTIYREAILEMCSDEQEVVDEVAITVVHEIAHYFGIDEQRLHQLGWG
ncbi:metallopeptidase family protein [Nocardia vermiculata]|uniref:Metallopeptidase family protein n=1 Tax=Nocardia vermiculata TaxID=257274 RepID=A0A846XXX8_9NOCA|nr:metallopeptidase family protein [Nocardia vermiculata]NKY49938.1 metallopeptidase family protein [Nocardia vermiculata]